MTGYRQENFTCRTDYFAVGRESGNFNGGPAGCDGDRDRGDSPDRRDAG
jgi:hypothetical protein